MEGPNSLPVEGGGYGRTDYGVPGRTLRGKNVQSPGSDA